MDTRTTTYADLFRIALGNNREHDPADQLAAIRAARARLDQAEHELAAHLRITGHTWDQIGTMWGMSRQAAHERFANTAGLLDKLDTALGRTPAD